MALSLAMHLGMPGMLWLDTQAPQSTADITFVDLTITAGPQITAHTPESQGQTSLPLGMSGESTPAESPSEPAVAPASDLTAEAEAQVATLEAIRESLQGQVDSLTTENVDLSARLEAERERATTLEQQLQAAREAEQARLVRVRSDYNDLVAALESEIADKVIALDQANERLTVTIVDRVLFPSGEATLTPEGRRVMARVGTVLARVDDRAVRVEGHTDDVPIGPALRERFPSNWELSTARATQVVRFLAKEGGVSPERLHAAGRADTEPTASNVTEDGRRQNRRIEIILLPPGQPAGGLEPS
ncbi:MAG: OmpA family protein [Candidatus Rokuibacteriota bacterium]